MTASITLSTGHRRFLVVDDERIVAEDISECVTAMGGSVLGIAITGQDAIDLADEHRPDLVLMDICLQGDIDGVEAALTIRDRWQIPVVFLTAYSDPGVLERAKAADPAGYIVKPFDEASLRSTIEIALHRCDLERALRGNREWLTTILTGMDDGVIVADKAGQIVFMNPAAERLTGWESSRVMSQPLAHVSPLYDGNTGDLLAHPSVAALGGGETPAPCAEAVLLRADASTVAVDVSGGAVRDRLGTITGVVMLVRDVSLARQTTRQLRLHQQHLESLVQERTGKIIETNRRLVAEIEERQRAEASLATRARLEALVNSISADFLALPPGESERGWPGALEKIGETLRADAVRLYLLHDQRPEISCRHEWCRSDQVEGQGCLQDRPFAPPASKTRRSLLHHPPPTDDPALHALATEVAELHGMASVVLAPLIEQDRLIGYLSLESVESRDWPPEAIDLLWMVMSAFSHTVHRARVDREKRRLQEQLTRAQRMEAVGQLSGGIAHDFNNTLLPIIGYADLLLARLPENDPTVGELTEIRRAAQHAATLTRQLLAVSKKQVVNKVIFDLNEELCAMRNLLQRVIGEDITLETRLEEGLPAILADPGQIQQVVMNLVVNARDAMPRGGVVVLRTRRADTTESNIPLIDGHVASGSLVCLSVEDSGTGIAPEIRDRIFDPFFSTKGNEGTGLGLAVIFSIVEQHHGGIDVETTVGEGTSFRVYLPASEKPAALPPIGPAAREAMPLGHGQRILLVEDEDAVNRFVTTALSKHGYEVLSAVDVRHAWQVFEKEKGRFDLIFSDAVLPDGNGVELIGRLLGHRPEMRALLSSGHTDKEALLRLAVEREISFLQKPYSLPDLLRTVNDVLNGTHQAVLN
jgi:PAS domain S-box-containing protein